MSGSGLLWLGARWFDSDTASFVSWDSVNVGGRFVFGSDLLGVWEPDGNWSTQDVELSSSYVRVRSVLDLLSRAPMLGWGGLGKWSVSDLDVLALTVSNVAAQPCFTAVGGLTAWADHAVDGNYSVTDDDLVQASFASFMVGISGPQFGGSGFTEGLAQSGSSGFKTWFSRLKDFFSRFKKGACSRHCRHKHGSSVAGWCR